MPHDHHKSSGEELKTDIFTANLMEVSDCPFELEGDGRRVWRFLKPLLKITNSSSPTYE
jgi:hypothetical protein